MSLPRTRTIRQPQQMTLFLATFMPLPRLGSGVPDASGGRCRGVRSHALRDGSCAQSRRRASCPLSRQRGPLPRASDRCCAPPLARDSWTRPRSPLSVESDVHACSERDSNPPTSSSGIAQATSHPDQSVPLHRVSRGLTAFVHGSSAIAGTSRPRRGNMRCTHRFCDSSLPASHEPVPAALCVVVSSGSCCPVRLPGAEGTSVPRGAAAMPRFRWIRCSDRVRRGRIGWPRRPS